MKNWSALDWCLFILTATIPVTILMVAMGRIITGAPMSDKGIDLVKEIMTMLIGGVLVKLGTKADQNKTT